ncbi:MAG TPA: hypothetical protein VMV88_03955, partial [Gallionella sp.]|nr:hypothetical protein [Gallionella sp.]
RLLKPSIFICNTNRILFFQKFITQGTTGMNKNTRLQILIGKLLGVGIVVGTLLAGCGGGGGGPAATVGGVYISAGMSPSTAPGIYSGVVVLFVDSPSGAAIANATVTINGVPLTYNSGINYYGNNSITPDGAGNFTLTVTANGSTYTATQSTLSWTPTITFATVAPNTISWTTPSGVSGMNYYVQIDGSTTPNVYSTPPASATGITVPSGILTAGKSYTATVTAIRVGPQIANTATGSNFSFTVSATPKSFTAQ